MIEKVEWLKCSWAPAYFVTTYVKIYDAIVGGWVPFLLWPAQLTVLDDLLDNRLVVILKARQVGLTWLVLAFALWLMLFRPAVTVLIFSRRDNEAVYLLVDRLKEMYRRLPRWMQARAVTVSSQHEFSLSNGSVARAFPTSAGDSYTASLAIVDEADLVPDLNRLMRAVKPTIDAGGRMILLSRSDKTNPQSEFKSLYRAAVAGLNQWLSIFLPWHVRPDRDAQWYESQKQEILSRTGFLDDLYEQYPQSDTEALAAREQDVRIPHAWLNLCYVPASAIVPAEYPPLPMLTLYAEPALGILYAIGVDTAEGNPTSDDSAITVTQVITGEEVAKLRGKFEPSTLGFYAKELSIYYNFAPIMVERNNHGHAVILWLRDNYRSVELLPGHDGHTGWLSSTTGKAILYSIAASGFRDRETVLHSHDTLGQLASIEGGTLRAPEGEPDDLADSYCLSLAGGKVILGVPLVHGVI
jgi:hypothetical protein